MGLKPFEFTKDWTRAEDFPVVAGDTAKARRNIQLLHNETRDYIDQILVPELDRLKTEETSDKQALADHKADPNAHTELFEKKADKAAFEGHADDRKNPHRVTAEQVGAQPAITGPEGSVVQVLPGGKVGGGVTVPELADQIAGLLPGQLLPRGIISMWSGARDAIPVGWALCDGTNGTPDLTDRFVVGAGKSYEVGATGGEVKHALTGNEMPRHGHGVNIPSHTHTFTGSVSGTVSGTAESSGDHSHTCYDFLSSESGSFYGATDSGMGRQIYSGTFATAKDGAHVHTVSGTATGTASGTTNGTSLSASSALVGGSVAHENRPPFYALCYIMKT